MDKVNDIADITWTAAGKVKEVIRPDASGAQRLSFAYDASGQRSMKNLLDENGNVTSRTHYVRDAQGNIMAVYGSSPGSLVVHERPMYGSGRLGTDAYKVQMWGNTPPPYDDTDNPLGVLQYELSDHLGNVTTTVTDELMPVDEGQDTNPANDYNQPVIVSAQGYEPGGSLLPGRNYSSGSYRFGFNGQEKDDEVFGATGTSYTAEFWQYDPRVARRWNIDPVNIPSLSPYHAFGLNPIFNVDPKGDKAGDYISRTGKHLGTDGIVDKKVYAADAVTKNKQGLVTSATNSQLLSMNVHDFNVSANVVREEAGKETPGDPQEFIWLAHVANNAKDDNRVDYRRRNTTLKDQLTDPEYSTTPAAAKSELSLSNSSTTAQNARAAIVHVLTGQTDPTGGAVLWDGVDFLTKGFSHNKFKEYTSVSIAAGHMWDFATSNRNYSINTNDFFGTIAGGRDFSRSGNPKSYNSLQSTGARGRSIFWKLGAP